jgi:prepilin-type N-terminal cleavage/methylation domain-containing protein
VRGARHARGFTLLEVLVVVGLMALLSAVFMPRLGGLFRFEIRRAASTLAAELNYVAQQAIATGSLHRWVVDLDNQVFRVERLREMPSLPGSDLPTHAELLDLRAPVRTEEFLPVESRGGEWRWLDEPGVSIQNVRVGDMDSGGGTVSIAFGPDGSADPAEMLLSDEGGHRLVVLVGAFTGQVRVEEPEGA